MDIGKHITLHSEARNFLFQYFPVLRRIFHDVLGHAETDYISIALISDKHEILFLSSKPSIEENLIGQKLWQKDPVMQSSFMTTDATLLWNDVYSELSCNMLHYYKLGRPKFSQGISISTCFETYRVVYSFALRSKAPKTQLKFVHSTDKLIYLGQYSLQRILKAIPLPIEVHSPTANKTFLKLIVNNEEVKTL